MSPLPLAAIDPVIITGMVLLGLVAVVVLFIEVVLGLRYIPNNRVGIVEKLWSQGGSVPEGRIIALNGEAGFQADVLRGGVHFKLWRFQYRIHKLSLVTVPQGQIGYVYARDGQPLPPSQTLGRVVDCNNFQDARSFLEGPKVELCGQRGRQRAILREGVYAINLALFTVITQGAVYRLPQQGGSELETLIGWQKELRRINGFRPVVVGVTVGSESEDEEEAPRPQRKETVSLSCPGCGNSFRATATIKAGQPLVCSCPKCGQRVIGPPIPDALPVGIAADGESQNIDDNIAIITVHDGPSLPAGEIIASSVGNDRNDPNYHNNFQDPEAFLRAGGCRGRQYVPLTDGTYFINRWFSTVELVAKTVVPIGYVGVVVSYYGRAGRDTSGDAFRHGERVAEGERGVWERPLGPGKYPFNPYAGNIILVPTTNFVLHWVTGKSEAHHYDESLRSIDLVTKDAYEPTLPLSVVVHIDYQKAPGVIQRFGDVKKLITQTLDPMLSAYFRDVAHKKTMLELLHERDHIQGESREELRRKFREFDIECVDVLIGKPDTAEAGGKIETLLEQLRTRQLSIEQIETYERQRAAAEKQQTLNQAQAQAAMQTQLTNSQMQIQIAENQGQAELMRISKQAEAELARARRQAEQMVLTAQAELDRSKKAAEQTIVMAQAESQQRTLAGRGESSRLMQLGLSEASVLLRKIQSFGDPRLYALAVVAEHLSHSQQPLVPERVFMAGANGENGHSTSASQGMLGVLINLLVAEKSGFQPADAAGLGSLQDIADRLTKEAMESMQQSALVKASETPVTVENRIAR